jgi:hypothetical protein
VYTSAGLSRHAGTTPTFATATWLNAPIFVETFNVTNSGGNIWSYASTSTGLPTFQVDMARHADAVGVGKIDTVAAEAQFVPPSSCQVFGWSSLSSSSTPAWAINVTNCDSSLLYDDDRFIDISDDGSTVGFSGVVQKGAQSVPTLWVLDGQTGAVRFTKTAPTSGPVQLSENGTWVAWTQGDSVLVFNGITGAQRAQLNMGWNCMVSARVSMISVSCCDTFSHFPPPPLLRPLHSPSLLTPLRLRRAILEISLHGLDRTKVQL